MKEYVLDVYIKKYIRNQKSKYLSNKNIYTINKLIINNNSKHFWRGWRTIQDSNRKSNCWKLAVDWHTPTVGIEPTAPPPSRSAVRHTNHCAIAPFPKRMVWTQLVFGALYRNTVLSPDVTIVTAQHNDKFVKGVRGP